MGYRYWVESFFENELRRAGGPNDLRGFPENSLPTYEFGQATLELRLRMGDEDYLAAFGEGGLIGLYPDHLRTFQTVGFALQAQLSVGLLRLTFAMGRLLPAPFEPRRTLVAIEWLSRF
jgi:outer membrane protein assembly factor BamA